MQCRAFSPSHGCYPALLTTILCFRLWPSSGYDPLLNFWDLLIKDEPREPLAVVMEIYSVWFFFYSLMYLLTYVEPQRSRFRPFKFHNNYPDHSLVVKEFLRSVKGVAAICSISVNKLHFHNVLPSISVPKVLILSELRELEVAHFFAGLTVFAWVDFHFSHGPPVKRVVVNTWQFIIIIIIIIIQPSNS